MNTNNRIQKAYASTDPLGLASNQVSYSRSINTNGQIPETSATTYSASNIPDIYKGFVIVTNAHTPKIPEMTTPAVVWTKENKPFIQEFIYFANNTSNLLGLASNQVAYNNRIIKDRFFVYRDKMSVESPLKIAIDPKIVEKHGNTVTEIEHCLSWPGKSIIANRYLSILVSYWNIDGEFIERQPLDRFQSQLWQHEIDHLEGIEEKFIDDSNPYKRTEAKVGRNDPCPCGSNKKFKNCCI